MTEIEKEYYRRLALQEEYGGTNKPVNKIIPLVSVVTITYQHAPYIRQCLDGILMQETDFPYEIIIGEDGSTDGTREICIEYANKYPDKIRLFLRDRKLTQYVTKDGRTIRFNGHFARAAARGRYVAMCEGDDYWIEINKLEMQTDIMSRYPGISMVFSNAALLIGQHYDSRLFNDLKKSGVVGLDKIVMKWIIPTSSILYRRLLEDASTISRSLQFSIPNFDQLLALKMYLCGKLYFVNQILCVYRKHDGGLSESFTNVNNIEFLQTQVFLYTRILKYFPMIEKRIIARKILQLHVSMIEVFLRRTVLFKPLLKIKRKISYPFIKDLL